MAAVTICSDFRVQENKRLSLFPLFPHLFAMKWWDQMPWSLFFAYWVLSQLFHFHLEALEFLFAFCHLFLGINVSISMFLVNDFWTVAHHSGPCALLNKRQFSKAITAFILAYWQLPSCSVLIWQRKRELFGISFYKDTNSIGSRPQPCDII